jgi:hypothetical protein
MANIDFYLSKLAEIRQRLQWIKDSLNLASPDHNEIGAWIQERCNYFESEISIIDKLIQQANLAYLPRIRTKHIHLENELLSVSNYVGILLREGHLEKKISKLVLRICHECKFPVADFLVTFEREGPAVSMGPYFNPIFYVRDESLASAYSWIGLFHEIGHIIVRHNRNPIIESLVNVVRSHYSNSRLSVGPVDQDSRRRLEEAINGAEKYWTEGRQDIRLEELFCDCFATFACGVAYLYSWLDFGVSFEEYPKFVKIYDEHPPFFARFEACWHILPGDLRGSRSGELLKKLWEDYSRTCFQVTNPHMEYGTVCNLDLLNQLAEKSVELIKKYWAVLSQWNQASSSAPMDIKVDETLASILNKLVVLLLHDCENYPKLENVIIQSILEE